MNQLMMTLTMGNLIGEVSIESILNLIRSPEYAGVYNGVVIALLVFIGFGLSQACIRITRRILNPLAADPRELFMQLCRAHELSSSQRRTLEAHAAMLKIEPNLLFIDSGRWHLEELRQLNQLRPAQFDRLQTLQRMLYEPPRLSVVTPS